MDVVHVRDIVEVLDDSTIGGSFAKHHASHSG